MRATPVVKYSYSDYTLEDSGNNYMAGPGSRAHRTLYERDLDQNPIDPRPSHALHFTWRALIVFQIMC